MKTYREWSPTTHDTRGFNAGTEPGRPNPDWFVCPVLITRDTTEWSVEASNFETLQRSLEATDPDFVDHEDHTFRHWGPGWFTIVLVRPGSPVAQIAQDAQDALETYPILDEMNLSMRESDAAAQCWADLDEDERREILISLGRDPELATTDGIPEGVAWECSESEIIWI